MVDAEDVAEISAAGVAASIGAPAATVHLDRLTDEQLVTVVAQGRHRYYRLRGSGAAHALECLDVFAGGHAKVSSSTPSRLRFARTCYDHMAGRAAVSLHDRLFSLGWLSVLSPGDTSYEVTTTGEEALGALGIDVPLARASRRRFAYGCIDWSERRPHVAGAFGAALLQTFLRKRWVTQEVERRALSIPDLGRRELNRRFGVSAE